MRRKIVAGNWKMNLQANEATRLFKQVDTIKTDGVEVLVIPPMLYVKEFQENAKNVQVGAQNCYTKPSGAFTGEVSALQLKSIGLKYVLIGHSERRAFFGEHGELLKEKVNACIEQDIAPIFCCGEPLSIRENNEELKFVRKQLDNALFHLDKVNIKKCVIAYEPVWAIGTGKTATAEQAESMHKAIRSWLNEKYGENIAEEISILYGGSCKPNNAQELFACPNVDGGLIGGASLEATSFEQIVNAF